MFSPAHNDPEAEGIAGAEILVPEGDPENAELAPREGDVGPENELGILVDCKVMTDVENPSAEDMNPLFRLKLDVVLAVLR